MLPATFLVQRTALRFSCHRKIILFSQYIVQKLKGITEVYIGTKVDTLFKSKYFLKYNLFE